MSEVIKFPEAKKENAGIYNHTFKTPFKYEGKEYVTVNFNFENLTGNDFMSIEKEMQDDGEYIVSAEMSRGFLYRLASKASGIGSDVIKAMPIMEFNKITNAARRFLLDLG